MDNPKAIVHRSKKYGKGVFAEERILKGEIIAEFDGQIYEYEYAGWDDELEDHVIQFEERKWRDPNGIARYLNHSCEPNCGIKDLFKIVAMRDIDNGEEITWDYDMSEKNEEWRMECLCGSPLCRREIGSYENMPVEVRNRYKGYISEWLLS